MVLEEKKTFTIEDVNTARKEGYQVAEEFYSKRNRLLQDEIKQLRALISKVSNPNNLKLNIG